MHQSVTTALSRLVAAALPLVDTRMAASEAPYAGTPAMVPHRDSRAQAMVHYGVFIPKLPDPYRYLNTMTLIGATGTEIFDNDELSAPDARDTATVLTSTAHADQTFYQAYDAATECEFAADGSHLCWGDDLVIDVADWTAHIVGSYGDFDVDITSTITDQVSYFVRTPIYDHLSLLAPFTGSITDGDGVHEIAGLGTFEYAHAMTPQALRSRPLPARLKLPADFFTYQIIEVDEQTQLLLTCVSARGANLCLTVHVRVLGESTRAYDDVRFDVLEYDDRQLTDPWGRMMRVPARFRWTAFDGDREIVELEATPDSTWRFGHGRGYVGAYTYSGRVLGREASGTGYLEWVDVQTTPRARWAHR